MFFRENGDTNKSSMFYLEQAAYFQHKIYTEANSQATQNLAYFFFIYLSKYFYLITLYDND